MLIYVFYHIELYFLIFLGCYQNVKILQSPSNYIDSGYQAHLHTPFGVWREEGLTASDRHGAASSADGLCTVHCSIITVNRANCNG